jgi:hypothetical protein
MRWVYCNCRPLPDQDHVRNISSSHTLVQLKSDKAVIGRGEIGRPRGPEEGPTALLWLAEAFFFVGANLAAALRLAFLCRRRRSLTHHPIDSCGYSRFLSDLPGIIHLVPNR